MKKKLTKVKFEVYYYENNKKILGIHKSIWGYVSGIRGYVSGIRGYVSGIWGDVSGIWGDLDLCEITVEDRKVGIKIEDLIEE